MKQVKIFPEGSYVNEIDFYSEIQYNIYVDFLTSNINKEECNILLLSEPDIITNISKNIFHYAELYDVILTHNQDILEKFKNAKFFLFNSIWASNKDYKPKDFSISTIVGNKTWTKQQIMRQELWFLQYQIKNRKFFASSFGPPSEIFGNESIGDNKDKLFYSQFHIAIENCSIKNYFSEKILDCFISKTIPIYCGCVNIGDFFNDKGIIKFTNINECIEKCNNLNENSYEEMIMYVEENYNAALKYLDWRNRLINVLNEINKS